LYRPRRQFFVTDRILLPRARFRPNFFMSAHLGADFLRTAMSFFFSPAFFFEPIATLLFVKSQTQS
jgi:hypothetical protein